MKSKETKSASFSFRVTPSKLKEVDKRVAEIAAQLPIRYTRSDFLDSALRIAMAATSTEHAAKYSQCWHH